MIAYECNVIIADAPHRDDLYLEIWIDERQFGEVYFDQNEKPIVEIYPSSVESKVWQIDYSCWQKIVEEIDRILESWKESKRKREL